MRQALFLLTLAACDGLVGDLDVEPAVPPETPGLPFSVAGEDAGTPAPDSGPVDAGQTDLGSPDAGPRDAGTPPRDADDGGPVDAGAPLPTVDAGPPHDAGIRSVDVLIAQGRLGRTMVSCDDGRTWLHDRDEAAGTRCGDPPLVECFHHPWASMGLVHTGTSVVATWGWGAPGRVRRTLDGVSWEDVTTGTSFGAITASAQAVIGAAGPPQVSRLDGQRGTWSAGGDLRTGSVTRHAAFLPAGGGRFFIALDDALKASDDVGATWTTVALPAPCLAGVRGLLAHGSTLILVRWSGALCTSTDRGVTWAQQTVASGFTSSGVYAHGAFLLWNGATRYRSVDGLTWTSAQSTPSDVSIGPVVVTRAGTLVAFKGGWQSEYADERIYRSSDGLTWQVLPATAHARSHPITHLVSGPLRASNVCP